MSTTITIRNVPDEAHDELVSRAQRSGQSLQEFLRQRLIELAARPDMRSVLERVAARKARDVSHLEPAKILQYRDAERP